MWRLYRSLKLSLALSPVTKERRSTRSPLSFSTTLKTLGRGPVPPQTRRSTSPNWKHSASSKIRDRSCSARQANSGWRSFRNLTPTSATFLIAVGESVPASRGEDGSGIRRIRSGRFSSCSSGSSVGGGGAIPARVRRSAFSAFQCARPQREARLWILEEPCAGYSSGIEGAKWISVDESNRLEEPLLDAT